MIGIFFNSFLIAFSGALMPGSLLTYTIDKSLKNGAVSGLVISAGHALLEFVLVILLLSGLNKILSQDVSQVIIGFAGGAVLLYFSAMMIRDVIKSRINMDFKTAGKGVVTKKPALFFNGAFISATNPYFLIWWTAVGLSFIMGSYLKFGVVGVAVFYFGHILADILWYTFVSYAVSKARKLFSLSVYKTVIFLLAVFLIVFAAGFFMNSISVLKRILGS
jgi:threonine/homoserine/homoserine lactone efflux protein